MTQYLRVRVGRTAYLAPSAAVGTILRHAPAPETCVRRPIDARRMAGRVPAGDDAAVTIAWHGRVGGPVRHVIVDEALDLVTLEAAEVAPLPAPLAAATPLFDGAWYDAARRCFLLRLRADEAGSWAERRRIAAVLAGLVVRPESPGGSAPTAPEPVP